jgi:hypothetical protein
MLAILLSSAVLAVAPPSCTHGQLQISHGPQQGSAGHLHWSIRFRNTSARACTLRGFPGVSAVNGPRGSQIGVPAARDPSTPVRRIRLAARGGAASALFTQTDVGVFDPAVCHPRRANGLRVFAPNQFNPFFLRLRHRVCSTPPGRSDSSVRAVVSGSTGR